MENDIKYKVGDIVLSNARSYKNRVGYITVICSWLSYQTVVKFYNINSSENMLEIFKYEEITRIYYNNR